MASTMVGADVERLRATAKRFEDSAAELEQARRRIDAAITQTEWRGPRAEGWRAQWRSRDAARLTRAAQLLRENARHIRLQADQQEQASGSDGGSAPGWNDGVTPGSPLSGQPGGNTPGQPSDSPFTIGQDEYGLPTVTTEWSDEWRKGYHDENSGTFTGPGGVSGTYETDIQVGVLAAGAASATLSSKGLDASASGSFEAGVNARASGEAHLGAVTAQGDVRVKAGVSASGSAAAHVGPDGASAKIGGEAMLGASASASGTVGVEGASATAKATGYAGVGVMANAEVSVTPERIKAKIEIGAAIGIGGALSFSVDIQPAKVVETVNSWLPWNW